MSHLICDVFSLHFLTTKSKWIEFLPNVLRQSSSVKFWAWQISFCMYSYESVMLKLLSLLLFFVSIALMWSNLKVCYSEFLNKTILVASCNRASFEMDILSGLLNDSLNWLEFIISHGRLKKLIYSIRTAKIFQMWSTCVQRKGGQQGMKYCPLQSTTSFRYGSINSRNIFSIDPEHFDE